MTQRYILLTGVKKAPNEFQPQPVEAYIDKPAARQTIRSMNAKIIAACEAFSQGDAKPAQAFIAEDIEWHIVGDRTIDGNAAVKEMCDDAASQGQVNFQNGRVIKAKNHIIVEGADLDSDMYYCDIYAIEKDQIVEITSYSLSGANE